MLEGEGVVGVAAPEQVGQLPDVVEQLVRVVGGGRLQEREVVLQVVGPVQQVEFVVGGEFLDPAVPREALDVSERRAPLVARVAVQVDDPGVGVVAAEPGEAEVDAVELQHRPAGGPLDQDVDVALQVGVPEVLVHEQVPPNPLLPVVGAEFLEAVVLLPVIGHVPVGGVGPVAPHGGVEPAALVERLKGAPEGMYYI